ncbi:MAG: hypothetical protein OSA42_05945 [Porticoccaceae bacterium]|nr:hypothetical protein [Porticoccaceae bacterium]
MKVIKTTKKYTVYKKNSGRFAVKDAAKNWVNADEKVTILLAEGLIKAVVASSPADEEALVEAVVVEEAVAKEASVEAAVVEDASAEEVVVEEAPVEETPVTKDSAS